VTGNVFDVDTTNNSVVASTTVYEAPIVVSYPINVNGKKVNNQTVATFTHASGVEPTNAFVATIDWGDGNTSVGSISLSRSGAYSVQGSHTYASGGAHTVATSVVEAGAEGNSVHAMALVSNTPVGDTGDNQPATIAPPSQRVAPSGSPAKLQPNAVDQALSINTPHRSALRKVGASDAVVDDLFAQI
jgi:hypothetical protein